MSIAENYDAVTVCGYRRDDVSPDNMYGKCLCGRDIMWRPHSPHGPRVLMLCFECAIHEMEDMRQRGQDYATVITKRTADEVEVATGVKIQPTENVQ